MSIEWRKHTNIGLQEHRRCARLVLLLRDEINEAHYKIGILEAQVGIIDKVKEKV